MLTSKFRTLHPGFLWLGFLAGIVAGTALFIVSLHQQEHNWDYVPHKSQYIQIGEEISPDGNKKAIIFAEKDDGLDQMRHVKILARVDKFDPNNFSPTRTKFPWQGIPAFDFSILRPVKLQLAWEDSKTLRISYPVNRSETITFQRSRSVTADVHINPSPAYSFDQRRGNE
ncbi:MAG: hypothetical protein K2X77_02435 [Candidatus Obscuribacterales bacterium]|nr:hypothetical protein [Candidatus Obscuribacterales bacterium]